MHSLTKDLTGQTFGRLTAIRIIARRSDGCVWECRCVCGNITKTAGANLRKGKAKSCGCLRDEMAQTRRTRHGLHSTPEYHALQGAKWRCYNPKIKKFEFYGGRGIKVCDRWRFGEGGKSGVECFVLDVGYKPEPKSDYSLDRIDSNGHYEPGNCRWATRKQQVNNMRSNVWLPLNGKLVRREEWCAHYGMTTIALWKAQKRGRTLEQIAERALRTCAACGKRMRRQQKVRFCCEGCQKVGGHVDHLRP